MEEVFEGIGTRIYRQAVNPDLQEPSSSSSRRLAMICGSWVMSFRRMTSVALWKRSLRQLSAVFPDSKKSNHLPCFVSNGKDKFSPLTGVE